MSFLVFASLLLLINAASYCPSSSDFVVAYGTPTLSNRGWSISGGGGVATKASYNLIGGSVEFDVDTSSTNIGVNANVYTISPTFSGSFTNGQYCDGQKTGSAWCTEIDWIETNGHCGGATTVHTREGPGSNGCTAWGCSKTYPFSSAKFHMKITFDTIGTMTVTRDGIVVSETALSPVVQTQDRDQLKNDYSTKGAVIYSSHWAGWVPDITGCSSSAGDLANSKFAVSNLQITGTVVQGPTPTLCSSQPPTAPVAPVPKPPTAPVTPVNPTPSTCRISGVNNNAYYNEVSSLQGSTVSIQCSKPSNYNGNYATLQSCTVSSWDKTVYQCRSSDQCFSPVPTCQVKSAAIAERTSLSDATGGNSVLIIGVVVGIVGLVLFIIAAAVFITRRKNESEIV